MAYNIHVENGIVNKGNLYRIKECMKKARSGEQITVGFLGGSITQGCLSSVPEKCYAQLVWKWWQQKFPETKIEFINAGIGATTSQYGVARVQDQLLCYQPDFILTEFAVNDENNDFFKETYEGLIRNIYGADYQPALMTMHNVCYDTGNSAEDVHMEIIKHYELPSVSMRSTIYPEIEKGTIKNRDITSDDLHPNDAGHELVASVIIYYLEVIYAKMDEEESPSDFAGCIMPKPVTLNRYENSVCYQNLNSTYILKGFELDHTPKEDIRDIFKNGFTASEEGSKIILHVEGTGIVVQYRKTIQRPTPVASIVIDGDRNNLQILDGNFNEDWGDCLFMQTIAQGLEDKEHVIEIDIIETHESDKLPFYLVSVVGSR